MSTLTPEEIAEASMQVNLAGDPFKLLDFAHNIEQLVSERVRQEYQEKEKRLALLESMTDSQREIITDLENRLEGVRNYADELNSEAKEDGFAGSEIAFKLFDIVDAVAVSQPTLAAEQVVQEPSMFDGGHFDIDAIAWAYNKCRALGLETASMESAMMMDSLKLMLMQPQQPDSLAQDAKR